jgi:hypothetical protein
LEKSAVEVLLIQKFFPISKKRVMITATKDRSVSLLLLETEDLLWTRMAEIRRKSLRLQRQKEFNHNSILAVG